MNSFQEQGRACYKRGDYKRAIEFFDRAIGHAASVQSLDNRAACNEKLNNLQAALKDAKKTIQLHREDPTGYLRAGKVLIKMEKQPVALEIYTHGLRCIKHVGQGYELLRSAHKELMSKLSPAKSIDPMTLLPRELAEVILEYLSFRQRMNACLVSRQWAAFIRSCPDLWRHLDLTNAQRKVRNAFISRSINVGRHKLRKASLTKLWDFDKALEAIVRCCPLEELALLETGLQGSNLTRLLIPAKHLKSLFMSPTIEFPQDELSPLLAALSEHLEQFECHVTGVPMFRQLPPLHRLHTLSITYNGDAASSSFFEGISERMPLLQSLTFRNEHSDIRTHNVLLNLEELPLRYLDLRLAIPSAHCMKLPETLITLKLHVLMRLQYQFWFRPGATGMEPASWFLPHLEELQLDIPGTIIHNVQSALNDCRDQNSTVSYEKQPWASSKLRKLSIVGARLNFLQISEFLKHPRLAALKVLQLPRLESCCDDDVGGIMDSLPKLEILDLSETDVTGIAVRRAVESGHLKDLIMNNCRKLQYDAVEWARGQGVRVQYRMSDGASGGRKIRQ